MGAVRFSNAFSIYSFGLAKSLGPATSKAIAIFFGVRALCVKDIVVVAETLLS
jgi:hypothetical protein